VSTAQGSGPRPPTFTATTAEAYDRFMGGSYSVQLAPQMADLAGVTAGQRLLDVGCGTGTLTAELVRRVGAGSVAAVDPSEPFVAAARARHPDVDVRRGTAEKLPFADGTFDAVLAQLVVHFMPDPVMGLKEMARVTRPDGVVAACVWDQVDQSPFGPFWRAVHELDPTAENETSRPGVREGHLVELFTAAGLREVRGTALLASVEHSTFDAWWSLFELGLGPAGGYVAGLDATRRAALRDRCRELLPPAPFTITGRAWAARGVVP
jgi:SAM-dependent methyltransferase